MTKPTILNRSQIDAVSGGSTPAITRVEPREYLPQDMYGNTMSVEAWMDYMADCVPNRGCDPHDFPGGRGL